LLNEELNKNILESNLLNCLLEALVGQDHIVRITVYEQNCLILYLGMPAGDASGFEVLFFAAVGGFDLHHSVFLLLPLTGYQL